MVEVKFKDLNSGEITVIEASTFEDAFNQACNRFGTEYVIDCMGIIGPDLTIKAQKAGL